MVVLRHKRFQVEKNSPGEHTGMRAVFGIGNGVRFCDIQYAVRGIGDRKRNRSFREPEGGERERRRRGDEKWMEKEVSGRWRTFMKVGERERLMRDHENGE